MLNFPLSSLHFLSLLWFLAQLRFCYTKPFEIKAVKSPPPPKKSPCYNSYYYVSLSFQEGPWIQHPKQDMNIMLYNALPNIFISYNFPEMLYFVQGKGHMNSLTSPYLLPIFKSKASLVIIQIYVYVCLLTHLWKNIPSMNPSRAHHRILDDCWTVVTVHCQGNTSLTNSGRIVIIGNHFHLCLSMNLYFSHFAFVNIY